MTPTFENPIRYLGYKIFINTSGHTNYAFTHEDFDGDEDRRQGTADSIEDAKSQIEDQSLDFDWEPPRANIILTNPFENEED